MNVAASLSSRLALIGMAVCPRCAGCPELDEDGHAYTCYFCCDEGVVTIADAEREERDATDAVEYVRLAQVIDGKFIGLAGNGDESWEVVHPLLPCAVFPVPARYVPVAVDCDDDIPF